MDGFTQRLLRRTDSWISKECSALNKLRLQLILNAITKDTLPLVAVELSDFNFSTVGKEEHGYPKGQVTYEENAETHEKSESFLSSASFEIDGLSTSEGSSLKSHGLYEVLSQCVGDEKQEEVGEVKPNGDSMMLKDSWRVRSGSDTCSEWEESPCSKGAVARAWTAVMCVGSQLKMGEQILLAHEVCEVDLHKEEVGKLNCSKMEGNANQFPPADEPQDVAVEMSTDMEKVEKIEIDCLTTNSSTKCIESHNSFERDGSAESGHSCEKTVQEYINQLQRKAHAQSAVVVQVSKALELCKMSTASSTEERVETERLLLLANQTRKALLSEVDRLKNSGPECSASVSKGMLFMRDITLPLTIEFVNAAKKEAVNFWFVILAIHQDYVVSTSATSELANGALYFAGPVFVPDLDENFTVFLNVYSLRLKQAKLERKRKFKVKKCKMFPNISKVRLSQVKIFLPPSTTTHSSSFTLVGSLELNASAVKHSAWPLTKVTASSPLSGSVHIKVEPLLCSVEVARSGFLSVLEEVSGGPRLWHHRWCDLEQCSFCFWNYPSEKILGKPALRCVDLRRCTSPVGPAPRELCSRPHAFLVTVSSSEPTLGLGEERHIFSAGSKKEMEEWCRLLNSVVAAIKLWSGPEL